MALALTSFHVALIVIAAAVFLAAAVSDAYTYRIPNYMCGLLLVLFPAFIATSPHAIDWEQSLAIFALVAVSGFAMFLGKLVGAGDIKLLSVASLWAGAHLIAVFLIVTALAGGVLSIAMALLTHWRHRAANPPPRLIKVPIPYGVAIATGGLVTLGMMMQPILFP